MSPAPARSREAASAGGSSAVRPGTRLGGGLVHTVDAMPGIARLRQDDGFAYRDANGRPVQDEETLVRIRRLAIPPAWSDVWICPRANGHLQATGRDARGRKQYRYHADWQALRGEDKFGRLEAFARALPKIRAQVGRDLRPAAASTPRAITRRLVLATLVRLLDTTFVRVGNEEYARTNRSYGLTTLRNRHAGVEGTMLRLRFRGKAGVMHEVELNDRRVAAVVRRCRRLPGQELFQYEDESGEVRGIDSGDVNEYLGEAAGGAFTAKDFRTWHGSVLALELTRLTCGPPPGGGEGVAAAGRFSAQAVLAQVARRLGNTPAVCRKAYVHPAVLELGSRLAGNAAELARFAASVGETVPARGGLSAAEQRFVAFLRSAARGGQGRRGRRAAANGKWSPSLAAAGQGGSDGG